MYETLSTLIEQLFAATPAPTGDAAVDYAAGLDARIPVLATQDLGKLEAEIKAAFEQVMAGTPDAGAIKLGETLADALDMVRGEQERRAGIEAAAASQRDALQARVGVTDAAAAGTATAAVEGEGEGAGDGAAGEGAGDGATGEGEGAGDGATATAAAAPAPAAAAPQPADLSRLAALQDPSAAPAEGAGAVAAAPKVKVTAAVEVPNVSPGSQFPGLGEIASAVKTRREALGHVADGIFEKVPVAHFDYSESLEQFADGQAGIAHNAALLAGARDLKARMALTASGGLCAPPETLYTFTKINSPDGLVQDFLPTFGVPRGSVQLPISPDIRDAFTLQPSRSYSVAQDKAQPGNEKTVTSVACPTYHTCEIGAQYVILKFGNLQTRAFPEWVEHWLGLSMDVHAHQVSNKLIGQMLVASNAVVSVGPNGGATSTVFGNLAMAAADYRSDLRMAHDATLEVMLPIWLPDLIRSDMFRARKGLISEFVITDAQIASWFAALNLMPRYVTDWQTVSGNPATGTIQWPAGLSFMLFAPGTFVKIDQGTLDLGVVRDSTLNKTNDYTIFVETFEAICKVGIESRVYSCSICANGAFSADQNLGCNAVDIPGS